MAEVREDYNHIKVELISFTDSNLVSITALSTRQKSLNEGVAEFLKKTNEERKEFIRSLILSEHFSPFEFIHTVFSIEGLSRVASHQLVRHRIASYLQQSFRHTEPEAVTLPLDISKFSKNVKRSIENTLRQLFSLYSVLVENGVSKDSARYLLPMGTNTHIVVAMNGRSLFNFFRLRLCGEASPEIRYIANKMKELLMGINSIYREIFQYANPRCFFDGYCPNPCSMYKHYIEKRRELLNLDKVCTFRFDRIGKIGDEMEVG